MQKAYAIGRQPQQELGGLGCKSYTEIKCLYYHLKNLKEVGTN